MRVKTYWEDEEDEGNGFMTGSASTLTPLPIRKVPVRAFPPGFHGANPGPSHDETPKPRKKVND